VFFDTLGVRWEHEPQGYALPHGPYLPDFRIQLSGGAAWFEVKHSDADSQDDRWADLAVATEMPVYVAFGMPRPGEQSPRTHGWMELFDPYPGWDNHRAFCVCLACSGIGIEFEGRSERMRCPGHPHANSGMRLTTSDHPRIEHAYETALSARFEHGERP